MKLIAFLTTMSIPFFTAACMKGPEAADCVLQPSIQTAPSDGYVEYFAVHSDRGFVKTLTYRDSMGIVTMDLPKLPLRIIRRVAKGTPLQISATGTTLAGHIVAGYAFSAPDVSFQVSDTCRR